MPRLRASLPLAALAVASVLAGCGSKTIELDQGEQANVKHGAELFAQRCAGCHTFSPAGTEGSAVVANKAERKDGPNLDQRKVEYEEALYAIRNGGFSSSAMPQNIVVGKEAEDVARFVEKYSGRKAPKSIAPEQKTSE
jgi:mono/diheme cytochrome c family protein